MAEKQLEKQKDGDVERDAETTNTIKVLVGSLGSESQELTLAQGTTLQDVVAASGLEGLEIRLNRQAAKGGTILQEGDVIIAVPDAIVGGLNADQVQALVNNYDRRARITQLVVQI